MKTDWGHSGGTFKYREVFAGLGAGAVFILEKSSERERTCHTTSCRERSDDVTHMRTLVS